MSTAIDGSNFHCFRRSYTLLFIIIREALGEGYDGDISFVNALETFGGGHGDPFCVAPGGRHCHLTLFIQ